jgi:insulysin
MVEFYRRRVLPGSPSRSKLAIHLHAPATGEGLKQTSITGASEKGIKTRGLKDIKKGESSLVKEDINRPTAFVIADVREFRSELRISAGPRAVKHISEFEEQPSCANPETCRM